QVDSRPLPRHGAGQPCHLADLEVHPHAGAALAHATSGVVDDQDALHPGTSVRDTDHLLRAPLIHQTEHVVHYGYSLVTWTTPSIVRGSSGGEQANQGSGSEGTG